MKYEFLKATCFTEDDSKQLEKNMDLDILTEKSINSLLRLMYKTCRNQGERIKAYLIQYKASVRTNFIYNTCYSSL